MRLLYEIEDDFNFLVNFFLVIFLFGPIHFCIFLCRPFPYSLPSGSSVLPLRRGRQPESVLGNVLWRKKKVTVLLWFWTDFFPRNVLSPVAGANEMLPYGIPFDSLSFYILPQITFLISKSNYSHGLFLTPPIFYPPLRELMKCSPMGSHLILFLFYILPQVIFLISKSHYSGGLFWPRQFFKPRCGS